MNKTSLPIRTVALTTLIVFVSSCLPFYAQAAPALNTAQTIAPNLMVIFGNSYSMNRELDDVTYPAVTPRRFNDGASGAEGGNGTSYNIPLFGDQPSSKFYVAKQALSVVLNDNLSDNINIGFATFRQVFGMEAAATRFITRGTWPLVEPNDTSIYTQTTQQKTDYGIDAANFKYTDWGRIWVSGANREAKFGKGIYDYNKGVVDDSKAVYMNGYSNGLPTTLVYKPGPTAALDYDPVTGNSIPAPLTTIHDQTITGSSYGAWTVFNGTGATGNLNPVTPTNALVKWRLCYTYYNSQNNIFQAFYLSDKDIIDTYPSIYSGNNLSYIAWGAQQFDSTGKTLGVSYPVYCPGFNSLYQERHERVSNTYKDDGSRVWFTGIPDYYSSWPHGELSGWSGETTYAETDAAATTGTTTANYPSGVADPDSPGRQLMSTNVQQTTAKHMGVFLDLPTPELGYVDNRTTVKSFMGLQQMNQSGEDYNPTSQTISGGKGIATSHFAYSGTQSPIYDSLLGALAYYTAYKVNDPYKNCRSNNILLFFDGKEDAHWVDTPTGRQYLKPSEIAAKLKDIGVKTYVIILSNNAGDISDATEIALAGGTTSAIAANSADSLLTAFTAVFSGLGGAKTTASPAMPVQISSGGKLCQASYTLNPVAGHLTAYAFDNAGYVDNTPLWDAAALMTIGERTSKLLSSDSSGGIVDFNSLDAAAFSVTGSPTVAEIKSYTIDPAAASGAYLAGRQSGSLMGLFSDQSMQPVLLMPPSNVLLDTDVNYTTYKTNQATRKTSVLVQNDDGFLYSFDFNNGALLWGWMPRDLVSGLKNYSVFWNASNMKGGTVIADAATAGAYKTYVLGTAQSGALHYALALKSDASVPPNAYPDSVAWVNNVTGATSPEAQAPVVSYLGITGYANYIKTVGSSSTLYVHKIATGEVATSAVLPFSAGIVAASEIVLDNGYFYVADTSGAVWQLPVKDNAADVVAATVKLGNTYNNQSAKFVGHYTYNRVEYVWVSSTTGITVFIKNAAGVWQYAWESHAGGAGSWDVTDNTLYTADTSGATIPSTSSIQMLPADATITARASVVNGALLLPVLIPDASQPCAAGNGDYHLYGIDNGFKPKVTFYAINADKTTTETTGNLAAGIGAPMSAAVGFSTMGTVFQASANQTAAKGNGITASYLVKGGVGGNGLVSWRETAH